MAEQRMDSFTVALYAFIFLVLSKNVEKW